MQRSNSTLSHYSTYNNYKNDSNPRKSPSRDLPNTSRPMSVNDMRASANANANDSSFSREFNPQLELANHYLQTFRYERALQCFLRVLQQDPRHHEAMKGVRYIMSRDSFVEQDRYKNIVNRLENVIRDINDTNRPRPTRYDKKSSSLDKNDLSNLSGDHFSYRDRYNNSDQLSERNGFDKSSGTQSSRDLSLMAFHDLDSKKSPMLKTRSTSVIETRPKKKETGSKKKRSKSKKKSRSPKKSHYLPVYVQELLQMQQMLNLKKKVEAFKEASTEELNSTERKSSRQVLQKRSPAPVLQICEAKDCPNPTITHQGTCVSIVCLGRHETTMHTRCWDDYSQESLQEEGFIRCPLRWCGMQVSKAVVDLSRVTPIQNSESIDNSQNSRRNSTMSNESNTSQYTSLRHLIERKDDEIQQLKGELNHLKLTMKKLPEKLGSLESPTQEINTTPQRRRSSYRPSPEDQQPISIERYSHRKSSTYEDNSPKDSSNIISVHVTPRSSISIPTGTIASRRSSVTLASRRSSAFDGRDSIVTPEQVQAQKRLSEIEVTQELISNIEDMPLDSPSSSQIDKERNSAILIQKNYRGYVSRKNVKSMKDQAQAEEAQRKLKEKENNSAILIQKNYRGYNSRKIVKSMKENSQSQLQSQEQTEVETQNKSIENKELKSAILIQKNYRGYASRKIVKSMKDSKNATVQNIVPQNESINQDIEEFSNFDEQTKNAIKIQSHYRGYRARKEVKNMSSHRSSTLPVSEIENDSIITIAPTEQVENQNDTSSKSNLELENNAALKIQLAYRQRIARKKTSQRLSELDEEINLEENNILEQELQDFNENIKPEQEEIVWDLPRESPPIVPKPVKYIFIEPTPIQPPSDSEDPITANKIIDSVFNSNFSIIDNNENTPIQTITEIPTDSTTNEDTPINTSVEEITNNNNPTNEDISINVTPNEETQKPVANILDLINNQESSVADDLSISQISESDSDSKHSIKAPAFEELSHGSVEGAIFDVSSTSSFEDSISSSSSTTSTISSPSSDSDDDINPRSHNDFNLASENEKQNIIESDNSNPISETTAENNNIIEDKPLNNTNNMESATAATQPTIEQNENTEKEAIQNSHEINEELNNNLSNEPTIDSQNEQNASHDADITNTTELSSNSNTIPIEEKLVRIKNKLNNLFIQIKFTGDPQNLPSITTSLVIMPENNLWNQIFLWNGSTFLNVESNKRLHHGNQNSKAPFACMVEPTEELHQKWKYLDGIILSELDSKGLTISGNRPGSRLDIRDFNIEAPPKDCTWEIIPVNP